MKKSLAALALAAASLLALAGCSATGAAAGGADGKVSVVATTDVYGSIASEIGGDRVSVTSIIDSMSKDPHEYEATARDRLSVRGAALVIENGGGYDPFMKDLLDGSKAKVVTAADAHPGHDADGFNEHVWFDPTTMISVVGTIEQKLTELDPKGKAQYAKGAEQLTADLAAANARLAAIKMKAGGSGVFITEPVPGYLADAAGLVDKAPQGFAGAVEGGRDVPPATLLAAVNVIQSGQVKAVLANSQAGGSETQRVEQEAKAAGVPVVTFSEILPKGTTYPEWMRAAIDSLARAVGA
ncbi:metal ABC transporter solute-binding protein, Zn/Mn family [Microbacterium sp. ASV81]|uniref:Zinc ABC transporter substrate-binding protein n=1 Tax=Microbacterium capsulatum TaxID=3041921 RepID=A0ABU0XME0_9MICO|nr:zinc ABC transporter substrate-binding protein [Microbacterium sp. ASV81]MDQ4214895.1 zinc ABC transporter substrate-binding protein [Microbacterium sp. ASV81]